MTDANLKKVQKFVELELCRLMQASFMALLIERYKGSIHKIWSVVNKLPSRRW